jgi:hypothetical protein
MYSHISVGDSPGQWMPAIIGLILLAGSYIFYHKKLKAVSLSNAAAVCRTRRDSSLSFM